MTAALSVMGGIVGAGLLVYLFYMLFESDKL
ncbi:MAG: potassium-transporting ATPase subunit F [Clostridiales bacterium]|nr:potassium-transporting ATPase subunit F [Clostridiales bacterium]